MSGAEMLHVGRPISRVDGRLKVTGEAKYAVAGNAPLIVNRNTGEVLPTGTARPVEQYIAEYEARHAEPRA